MHQGRSIAAEFIGFTESQSLIDDGKDEPVTAH